MSDPSDQEHGPEAPTLVGDTSSRRRPTGAATATPTPPPTSPKPPISFSEAPTLLGNSYPTMAPTAIGDSAGTTSGKGWAGVLLEPGSSLANRYEILEIIGEGGMGAVYKA